ncbi:Emp24 protein [Saccharomycopsis crataegensis]|uniref:Emp24 protein n=1 Tax=Saccharomycopsis crataegensis TaxID=43959 RepID=A0AAV5QEL9_9ASCO|nr:Emp24 protein [Saccharomycopsis crataegensis]
MLMLNRFFSVVLLLVVASAHNVLLAPYNKQCFFETLKANDELAVSFQVGDRNPQGTEQLTCDFWILNPSGQVVKREDRVSHGDFSTIAKTSGKFQYCFSNEGSSIATKDVSFNIHGVIYIDVNDPNSNSLEASVKRLSQLTNEVKDQQNYIIIRERTHRNTAESTNSRVKWWSVFQLIVVGVNSVFQVYYLKRFFEVKSVV